MLKKDSTIFLQNINMIARQLFLLFKILRLSGTTLVHTLILDVNLLERSTGYNLTSREATDLLLRLFRVYVADVSL